MSLTAEGLLAFKVNESITVGEDVSVTAGHKATFTAPPRTRIICYFGQVWEERSGTVGRWDIHGYRGDIPWSSTYVSSNYGTAQTVETTY